jgi:hypothetical protein
MFGGDVISLILPKLILSVALDGILTFSISRPEHPFGRPDAIFALFNDNKQACRVQRHTCFCKFSIFNRFVTLK